ncbi:MAG: hypothetical protein ACFCUX_01585 [Candidatus Methylacidiphilales bacterium]
MTQPINYAYWIARVVLGLVGFLILTIGLAANHFSPGTFEGWPVTRVVAVILGFNFLLVSIILFMRPIQIWLMRSFAFRAMAPWSLITLSLSQAVMFCVGLSICLVVITADWLGIDPTPGFGKMRALQLASGLSLLLATYLLHSKPLQRWVVNYVGAWHLRNAQGFVLNVSRLLLFIAGIITILLVILADVLKTDPTPGWSADRTIHLFVGLSLLAASFVLKSRKMKNWFVRSYGYSMISPMEITIMMIARALVLMAGATITFLVVFADVLKIDPTPGWGRPRMMQLLAGLALLMSGFILHKRRFWRAVQRSGKPVTGSTED